MLDEIFSFISFICETKYLTIDIYGTALTLFHYYTYFKSFKEIDRVELSVSCCYLAAKINYRFLKLEDMVALCNDLRVIKNTREPKIVDFELDLMDGLGYDINLFLPYHYFGYLCKKFKFDREKEKIVHNLINESFRRPLCLFFHPKTICLCAFYISEKYEFRIITCKDSILNNITNKELNSESAYSQNLNEKLNKNQNIKTINGKKITYNFLANYEIFNLEYSNNDDGNSIKNFDKEEILLEENDVIKKEFELCFENFNLLIISKIKN